MAKFEPYDSDDLLSDDSNFLEMECPLCGKDISLSPNDIDSKITCPHCKAEIEIASE